MIGTAQGFKYKRQQIGDLLISEQILRYETLRDVDKTSQEKEAYLYMHKYRLMVSPRLLSFFKNASILLVRKTKKQPSANFGLIFSSNEAMDQQTTFHYVNKFAPDAIGIEIAAGSILFSVAQRHHIDCIMVKGISCYADEPFDQDAMMPEIACTNAARFTLQVIELGGFHASIPQPRE
jgi:nucleoside phosphorylase